MSFLNQSHIIHSTGHGSGQALDLFLAGEKYQGEESQIHFISVWRFAGSALLQNEKELSATVRQLEQVVKASLP